MTIELIKNLQNPTCYPHTVSGFRIIETHISWVILTGDTAYKIKKPLNLGFLDFSTLEKRHRYCQLELQLNQTLAPQIYQDLIRITGSEQQPEMNGDGPVIEYAIKMREFPQEALFDHVLARNELTPTLIDELADVLAQFHQQTAVASATSEYGTPKQVYAPVVQNFEQIKPFLQIPAELQQLEALQTWASQQYAQLTPIFEMRKAQGFIRACHGDVHLGNIILLDQHPTLFDCIEFNEGFRWTDIMADLGFLVMDLVDHQRRDYAHRFINRYLETTGDYQGLYVLPFYIAYRAMVRAKVSLFRLHQPGITAAEQKAVREKYQTCTTLAAQYTQRPQPILGITHGVSGTGKSTLAKLIVEHCGAVQIRSDVERKRLFGLKPLASSRSPLNQNIYSETATEKTYQHLVTIARACLQAGYTTVIDATFLKQAHRALFSELAQSLQLPFVILSCQPSVAQAIPTWVKSRVARVADPSEATMEVLDMQLASQEPLTKTEQQHTLYVNTEQALDSAMLLRELEAIR